MRVTVLLFAGLAEDHRTREVVIELSEHARAGEVWTTLRRGHPHWGEIGQAVMLAVNGEFQPPETLLHEGDTVALLPPMSGGSGGAGGAPEIPLSTALVRGPLPEPPSWSDTAIGAVVRFEGITRAHTPAAPGRRVVRLEYEAYEEMAEARLAAIAREAVERWDLRGIEIVHRLGNVPVGEASVRVLAAAAHRDAAFIACRFAIDTVKRSAPIWKKEFFDDGSRWADGEMPAR